MNVYERLGVRRVVNARGRMTLLGGSVLPTEVIEAMMEANQHFVDLEELQDKAGVAVAQLLGAEAACVTSGAFAALVLATAACMTRGDRALMDQVPNTSGMRNEVLIQRGLRTKYDRAITVAGARLIEVGDEAETRPQQLEDAITPQTAAIHFLAPGRDSQVPLQTILQIAHAHDIPVIVDAAGQVLPPTNMQKYVQTGADCVSYGAKYFDGPNSAGILCGRKDLLDAAKLQTFVCFETEGVRALGRGMKLDRQEIIATVVALQRWLTMDHQARLTAQHQRILSLVDDLNALPGITATAAGERMGIMTSAHVTLDPQTYDMTSQDLVEQLKASDPRIWVNLRDDTIVLGADTLVPGDEQLLLDGLKKTLKL